MNVAHTSASDELDEFAASFAVESLDSDERRDYSEHLGHCEICAGLVAGFGQIADVLPESLETGPPQDALKQRILTEAHADIKRASAQRGAESQHDIGRRWWSWFAPVPAPFAAVLVAAVFALAGWAAYLQLELGDRDDTLADQDRVLSAIAAGGQTYRLDGTDAAPDASATLVEVPGKGESLLVASSLPNLPSDREYQVWRIQGETPTSAGTFAHEEKSEQIVAVSAVFAASDGIGVSIEPLGGSSAPTGDIVLLRLP